MMNDERLDVNDDDESKQQREKTTTNVALVAKTKRRESLKADKKQSKSKKLASATSSTAPACYVPDELELVPIELIVGHRRAVKKGVRQVRVRWQDETREDEWVLFEQLNKSARVNAQQFVKEQAKIHGAVCVPEDLEITLDSEGNAYFGIERILKSKKDESSGKTLYLIHWKGFSSQEDSWEPEENLTAEAHKNLLPKFRKEQKESKLGGLPKGEKKEEGIGGSPKNTKKGEGNEAKQSKSEERAKGDDVSVAKKTKDVMSIEDSSQESKKEEENMGEPPKAEKQDEKHGGSLKKTKKGEGNEAKQSKADSKEQVKGDDVSVAKAKDVMSIEDSSQASSSKMQQEESSKDIIPSPSVEESQFMDASEEDEQQQQQPAETNTITRTKRRRRRRKAPLPKGVKMPPPAAAAEEKSTWINSILDGDMDDEELMYNRTSDAVVVPVEILSSSLFDHPYQHGNNNSTETTPMLTVGTQLTLQLGDCIATVLVEHLEPTKPVM